IFCLLLFPFALIAEEIEITLPTQREQKRIYLTTCRSSSHELSALINHVLEQDFIVDGRGEIFHKNEISLQAEAKKGREIYQNAFWRKERIDYVITPVLKESSLSFEIFSVQKGSIKTLSSITISNSREQNIFTVHKFSDFLMQEVFGSKGIASKRILYSYKPATKAEGDGDKLWNAEIYEIDTLGLTTRRVTFENSYAICPEFLSGSSGNNYDFVYVNYKNGLPQIVLGNAKGDLSTAFVKLRGNQLLPKVSYDGSYLSFISDAAGRSDVFLQKVDSNHKTIGRPMQIFSSPRGTSSSPHLSPNNKWLTFVCDQSGRAKIYLANIESTLNNRTKPRIQRISCPCSECTAPCFSPDGEKIAFSGRINGRRQIWIYDINTKRAEQLTHGVEDKENPCFGSNGRHLVYNTTSPTTDLYLLDTVNKKTRRLTKGSGEKHYPALEK
nr:DPP IV N-terminal domain-containing protein [bacterium]